MNRATLRTLFRERLLALETLPRFEDGRAAVGWQETPFTAPVDRPYLLEDFRVGAAVNYATGYSIARPLLFLDLHTPQDVDGSWVDAFEEELARAFEAGREPMTSADESHLVELVSYNGGSARSREGGGTVRRITIGATAFALRTLSPI